MVRPLSALVLFALVLAACASPFRVLVGRVEGQRYALDVRATCQGPDGVVHLAIENKTEEPVGFELDALLLREPDGRVHRVLGRLAKKGGTERVSNGAALIDPHGHLESDVEFDRLPDANGARLTLVVPSLFQLGIDGEKPMPSVEVSLAYDRSASAAAERAAFHDPFVEE